MGLIKEPKEVDFIIQSEPWTEKELADFRDMMKKEKSRQGKKSHSAKKKKQAQIFKEL